jgi:hypothetical protein
MKKVLWKCQSPTTAKSEAEMMRELDAMGRWVVGYRSHCLNFESKAQGTPQVSGQHRTVSILRPRQK